MQIMQSCAVLERSDIIPNACSISASGKSLLVLNRCIKPKDARSHGINFQDTGNKRTYQTLGSL
jgi:hypothetical protein